MKRDLTDIAEYALNQLKSLGADGAECTVSEGRTDELNVENGKFSLVRTTFDEALTVTAFVGGRRGAFAANGLNRDAVENACGQAVENAKISEPDDANFIPESFGEKKFGRAAGEPELDKMYESVKETLDEVKEKYPSVDLSEAAVKRAGWRKLYANSGGTRFLNESEVYTRGATFAARDGEKVSAMNGAGAASENLDTPFLDAGCVRRKISDSTRSIDTKPVEGKFTGPILVSPDCLEGFLTDVLGNTVMNAALISGSSPWKDKLGQTVADKRLSVTFNPLDPRVAAGARFTDDGYPAEPAEVIKDGVLTGFLLNRYGAKKTGFKRSGNVSGNMIVAGGDESYGELLAGIEKGLLVDRFSGGSPGPDGELSGVAKNSFLIENGKVTDAVSETMISANLYDMLKNIVGISREVVCDGSSALPWILFGGVTISGK